MKVIGDTYEERAATWLQDRGLHILERNFRASTGEIDIIARETGTLVFVEVRARSHGGYAGAAESVTAAKRKRIVHTAQLYLQQHRALAQAPCRFDVIAFEPPQSGAGIRWIRSAFNT